jgi:hypothetical protein
MVLSVTQLVGCVTVSGLSDTVRELSNTLSVGSVLHNQGAQHHTVSGLSITRSVGSASHGQWAQRHTVSGLSVT